MPRKVSAKVPVLFVTIIVILFIYAVWFPKGAVRRKILFSHPKKQDIFYLSSPRWSHNIYTSPFKVPGPAYYSPYPN